MTKTKCNRSGHFPFCEDCPHAKWHECVAQPTPGCTVETHCIEDGGSDTDWRDLRRQFAAMAMQGLCAEPSQAQAAAEKIAGWSVQVADALIDELKRREEEED